MHQHFVGIIEEYSTRELEMKERGDGAAAAEFAGLFSAATELLSRTKKKFQTRLTRKRQGEVEEKEKITKKQKRAQKRKRARLEPPAELSLHLTSFCCHHAKDYAKMAAANEALLVGCVCVSMY